MKWGFRWRIVTTFFWKRSRLDLWFWERILFWFKKVNHYISCARVGNVILLIRFFLEEMSWSLYILLWFFRLIQFALRLLSFLKRSNLEPVLWFVHIPFIYLLDRRHMTILMSTKSHRDLPWIYVILSDQIFLTNFALSLSQWLFWGLPMNFLQLYLFWTLSRMLWTVLVVLLERTILHWRCFQSLFATLYILLIRFCLVTMGFDLIASLWFPLFLLNMTFLQLSNTPLILSTSQIRLSFKFQPNSFLFPDSRWSFDALTNTHPSPTQV